jgi:hypothetical protein
MITISLDKKLDEKVFCDFYDFSIAGVNFGEKIKQDHPNITKDNYLTYIDNFYKENSLEMQNSLIKINKILLEKQDLFFDAVENLFKKDFRDIKASGFLSIFDCNPRYLEEKSFQMFYKRNDMDKLEVVFHELLHFIFFDYCDSFLKEETKDLDKNKGVLWELSEIFNVIVLNLPQFREILQGEECLFYSDLKEKLKIANSLWLDSRGDIKNFITSYLKKLG